MARGQTISGAVQEAVREYLRLMEDEPVNDLYDLVLAELEAPLLRTVMAEVRQNQSRAAEILGLSRGTLRKKLRRYHLL